MNARPTVKRMWVLLHVPSGTWDHGAMNETLYWSEHDARLAVPRGHNETLMPIAVDVIIAASEEST